MTTFRIRPGILAGTWYPNDRIELRQSIEVMLARAELQFGSRRRDPNRLQALILPHAGHRYSGKTCAMGVCAARGGRFSKIFLLGPSHRAPVSGAVLSDATHFETPLGAIPVDLDTVRQLQAAGLPVSGTVHAREHSLEIILPFLQIAFPQSTIVPILIGSLTETACADLAGRIKPCIGDRSLVIASSDFVHYGADFNYLPPVGPDVRAGVRKIDEGAVDCIRRIRGADLLAYQRSTGATICGILPIAVLLDIFSAGSAEVELLDYSQSADVSDDTDHMVSYAAIALYRI